MPSTPEQTIINLETKFWQSMVDSDTDTAFDMLTEPALAVSAQDPLKSSGMVKNRCFAASMQFYLIQPPVTRLHRTHDRTHH